MLPDKKAATLQKIDDAVQRMTHMLENVLVIGRTDAGRVEFKPRWLSVTTFCLSLVDEVRSAMSRHIERICLQIDMPPPENLYLLDDSLIRNIVGNLLSNAIKYSPEGGEVRFSISPQGQELARREQIPPLHQTVALYAKSPTSSIPAACWCRPSRRFMISRMSTRACPRWPTPIFRPPSPPPWASGPPCG